MLSDNLILVDKPYGATPLEAIQALRRIGVLGEKEKATYAGRLDPLATGLLLILKGEGVHEKENLLGLNKTYEIEIVFGVETDTGDLLGMPHTAEYAPPTPKELATCLESISESDYPAFSSKTVEGKPLHEYAREGISIPRPSRKVQYHITKSDTIEPISSPDLKSQAQHACEIVQGDFRQEAIQQAWEKIDLPTTLKRYAFTVEVTSGTYMRSIPEIVKNTFGATSVITKIHRVRVGEFNLQQAIKI